MTPDTLFREFTRLADAALMRSEQTNDGIKREWKLYPGGLNYCVRLNSQEVERFIPWQTISEAGDGLSELLASRQKLAECEVRDRAGFSPRVENNVTTVRHMTDDDNRQAIKDAYGRICEQMGIPEDPPPVRQIRFTFSDTMSGSKLSAAIMSDTREMLQDFPDDIEMQTWLHDRVEEADLPSPQEMWLAALDAADDDISTPQKRAKIDEDLREMLSAIAPGPLRRHYEAEIRRIRATAFRLVDPPTGWLCPRCGTVNNPRNGFCNTCHEATAETDANIPL